MTIKLSEGLLIETDDSVPPQAGSVPGTVIIRIKDGDNWNGNQFKNCTMEIPKEMVVDVSGRA